MSNWVRKEADILADAIGKHIRNNPDLHVVNQRLAKIRIMVDGASITVNTTQGELVRYRTLVCAECRGSKLYECDVPVGWSANCALIFHNTSQFSDL